MRRTARTLAELPQFGDRALVVVDQVVELELVDLAGIKLCETRAHVLEEDAQRLAVIDGDRFAGGTSFGLLVVPVLGVGEPRHAFDATAASREASLRCPRSSDTRVIRRATDSPLYG